MTGTSYQIAGGCQKIFQFDANKVQIKCLTGFVAYALGIVFGSGQPKTENYRLGIKIGQKYLFTPSVGVVSFSVGLFLFINTT
jgi:hypothetical protein